jgi:hypothetical protein
MSGARNGVIGGGLARWRYDNSPDGREARLDRMPGESSHGWSGGNFKPPAIGSFKQVAIGALDCALAHWYMVPGLKFQRSRVRLGLKSLFGRGRLPVSALSLILHQIPSPASYLGFHFASRFLSRDTLGSYLDVASHWLFPFTLLSSYQAASATLLTLEASRLRSLLSASNINLEGGIHCEAENIHLADESYDTITSLCGAGGVVGDVRNLWRSLKPGGTLLLSLPCVRECTEPFNAGGERLYDGRMLEQNIFEVLGQPKRYAIYGAQTPACGNEKAPDDHAGTAGGWGGSSAIGRGWRCYAGLQELPGEGVMVMKFSRPERNAETTGAAFASHLC